MRVSLVANRSVGFPKVDVERVSSGWPLPWDNDGADPLFALGLDPEAS